MEVMQRIMITRPAHQAGKLAGDIVTAGASAFLFPTLEICRSELGPEQKANIHQIAQYDIIIFISPNAVEHGLDQIQAIIDLPDTIQLATIGQGSAKALINKLGKQPDICPTINFNSEGLLATTDMQNVADKHILILRGNSGREHLKETLEERGAVVDYINVYQRIKPTVDSAELEQYLQNNEIAAIVITSAESLNNLVELTPQKVTLNLLQIPLLLINKRLIEVAKNAKFKNKLMVATEASDEGMIETLKENNLLKPIHRQ